MGWWSSKEDAAWYGYAHLKPHCAFKIEKGKTRGNFPLPSSSYFLCTVEKPTQKSRVKKPRLCTDPSPATPISQVEHHCYLQLTVSGQTGLAEVTSNILKVPNNILEMEEKNNTLEDARAFFPSRLQTRVSQSS